MGPLLDVRKVLDRVSVACNVPKRTVTRINGELKLALAEENREAETREEDATLSDNEAGDEEHGVSTSKKIKISTPRSTPLGSQRSKPVTGLDEFAKSAIRRHILQYYERQEIPTLVKLECSLKNAGLFDGGRTSLYKIVRELGFVYKKLNHRRVLMEKPTVALLRCQFVCT